jgi:8-oxo-dGTP pyrophosphatase MutT (NUDIX family)
MLQPNKNSNLSENMRSFPSLATTQMSVPPVVSSTGFRTFPGLVSNSQYSNQAFSRTPRISNPVFSRTLRTLRTLRTPRTPRIHHISNPSFSRHSEPGILVKTISQHPYMYTKTSAKEWDQPIFAYNRDTTCKISAAGILYYKKIGGKIQVLVFQNQDFKKLEDLGGKTDISDKSPLETACREAEEETKKKISKETSHKILKSVEPIYIPESSYLLYIAEASEEIQSLVQEDFGSTEECNNKEKSWVLNRIINWMPLEDFLDNSIGYNIHPRLTYALSIIRSIGT